MKIVCIKSFRDKTTAKKIEDQKLIKVNDVLDCDIELAQERIRKGFAKAVVEVAEVVEETIEAVEETTETEEAEEVKPKKKRKNK